MVSEGDDSFIISGFHWVNRDFYFVTKKEVEIVVETKVEPAVEAYVKQKIQEIDVEKATKAIETRLAEIATEKKVTAKEIKAKVKKTPDTTEKPASKPVKSKSISINSAK